MDPTFNPAAAAARQALAEAAEAGRAEQVRHVVAIWTEVLFGPTLVQCTCGVKQESGKMGAGVMDVLRQVNEVHAHAGTPIERVYMGIHVDEVLDHHTAVVAAREEAERGSTADPE